MATIAEVFRVFLKLGLTSFGGPIAHIGYYREELVARRGWLSERAFADLVALCHFLPGPASSQTGVAIGYHRAGPGGALAAFIAFAFPSAAIMATWALGVRVIDAQYDFALLRGFELAALGVVAQAVLSMQRQLCPDWPRRGIALLSMVVVLAYPGSSLLTAQIGVIIMGGILGSLSGSLITAPPRDDHDDATPQRIRLPSLKTAGTATLLAVILLGLSFWPGPDATTWVSLLGGVTQAGALVFGGGHVVLPLLESVTSDWIERDLFLAGYGAAQALPGPLFSFAAYIGMMADSPPSPLLAFLCLAAVFAPGFLFLFAALPFWGRLASWHPARTAMTGINAAVVGLLAAALIDPLGRMSIRNATDASIVLIAFLLLSKTRIPVWAVVIMVGLISLIRFLWTSS